MRASLFGIAWLWEKNTFQKAAHWLPLTQLRCVARTTSPSRGASPSAMSLPLCITPLFAGDAHPPAVSTVRAELGRENTRRRLHVRTSRVFRSLPVTPHCFPLPRSQQYLWEHLCINFLLDYRSHAKDNLAWCGFKSSISLWRRSPLPALICGTLYSPMPDGRLKSIFVPTEMCFFEHYIKPQSGVQRRRARGAKTTC